MEPAGKSESKFHVQRQVTYRCSCGGDVRLPAGGEGTCQQCGRQISLQGLEATQTVSFCSEAGSGTSFHLVDGPDRSGETVGHFRLLSKLGYGGMGAVYRALDESLQRFVAVKVMRSVEEEGTGTAKQVTRLLDEAVSQARLNHPNVVTIYYVGRQGEEPFFAMELLPGPTLAELLNEGPVAYGDVIHFAMQIVDALKHASRHGLVHGDIKPSNLILADPKTVKLSDFGLARTERTAPTKGISGTISHMAPELASGNDPSDQSDMYSLGVTLFEMTFGRRPYDITGTTLREQLKSHRGALTEFPEKWPSTVPEQWREFLERLMQKASEDRYADYEALEHELMRFAPVGVTNAGILNRGLAYLVDLAFWGIWLALLTIPAMFANDIVEQLDAIRSQDPKVAYWFHILANRLSMLGMLAPLVPMIATWAEWRGWRTLGRYLFQLRIVDQHGLRLNTRKRAIRSIFRYAPLYSTSLGIVAIAWGFNELPIFIAPIDRVILLISTILVLGPRRMSLHDRIVGSHVVLDTHSGKS